MGAGIRKEGEKKKKMLSYRLISCEAMWNSMSFVDTEKAISLIEKVAGFGRHFTFCRQEGGVLCQFGPSQIMWGHSLPLVNPIVYA